MNTRGYLQGKGMELWKILWDINGMWRNVSLDWSQFQSTIRLCIRIIWIYLIGMAVRTWPRLFLIIILFTMMAFYMILYYKMHHEMKMTRLIHCHGDSNQNGLNRSSCLVSQESDVSDSIDPNTSVQSKEILKRKSEIIVGKNMTDYSTVDCNESTTCGRFKKHMLTWPRHKPRAAIYVLCGGMNPSSLTELLYSLFKYFNAQYEYPVIIFYTSEEAPQAYSTTTDDVFINKIKNNIFFQRINFLEPSYFPAMIHIRRPSHGIGYRHMCRFHAKLVYTHPIMADLEFAWRLDDDSQILGPPIHYDIFQFMSENDLLYGYQSIELDSTLCTTNLWKSVMNYTQSANITPKFCWPAPQIFYNNFEVSHQSVWRSKEYEDYFNFIDSLGGIYKYRWGDAPIKSLALSLFVSPNKVHLFDDIGYFHQSFRRRGIERKKPYVTPLNEGLPCLNSIK